MIKVNGVLSTDFLINLHFLFLGKLIDCVVKYKKKKLVIFEPMKTRSLIKPSNHCANSLSEK